MSLPDSFMGLREKLFTLNRFVKISELFERFAGWNMSLKRTGFADLRLHGGYAPRWLFSRMVKLAKEIFVIMVDEFGTDEVLARLSNPLFFQACSNVLGFDWDSSGATTVTCGVLKDAFASLDVGMQVAGGKGKRSRNTLAEVEKIGEGYDFPMALVERLKYSSRMTAKVDGVAIQAGYSIYHHAVFVSEDGKWTVIQQGMNPEFQTARRYHWLSRNVKSFVVEPHEGIVGQLAHKDVLDMTAKESEETRRVCTDIAKEGSNRVERLYSTIRKSDQESLSKWIETGLGREYVTHYKVIPRRMDWKALKEAYETQPKDYEELLAIRGIGPATVRGLALVSELIFGKPPSWRDPVKYSFAYGGKDGVPFPVDRRAMDESIQILKAAVEQSKLGSRDKLEAIRRLRKFAPT